jgi:Rrf2 family protein
MLKLSTKGRYGLRAMVELARIYNNGPMMMSAITKRQEISRKYLHAILTALKGAGLVRAVRGAKGGFMLTKDPGDIGVHEIYTALEGKLSIVDCLNDETVCGRVDICETRDIWRQLNDAMLEVLSGMTLADLVRKPTDNTPHKPDMCAPKHRKGKKS